MVALYANPMTCRVAFPSYMQDVTRLLLCGILSLTASFVAKQTNALFSRGASRHGEGRSLCLSKQQLNGPVYGTSCFPMLPVLCTLSI